MTKCNNCCPSDTDDPDVQPCSFVDGCEACSKVQEFDFDGTETVIENLGGGNAFRYSATYDGPRADTCGGTYRPFIRVHCSAKPSRSAGGGVNIGSLQDGNPYTVAAPHNATGDADNRKLVFRKGGTLHNGQINLWVDDGGNLTSPPRWGHGAWTSLSGNYYIPKSALYAASQGTHFTKTAEFAFGTEHFGCPVDQEPLARTDNQRAVDPFVDYWNWGALDYNGGAIFNQNRGGGGTRRWGLQFSRCDFLPWVSKVSVFAMSQPDNAREYASGTKIINSVWGGPQNPITVNHPIHGTTIHTDSDGVDYTVYDEVMQAEGDRRVFLAFSNPADAGVFNVGGPNGRGFYPRERSLPWASDFAVWGEYNSVVVDTGATVSQMQTGHAVTIEATTTNVTFNDNCDFEIEADVRIQIPTIGFDRTFEMLCFVPRCLGIGGQQQYSDMHLARSYTYWVKRGPYGFVSLFGGTPAAATDFNESRNVFIDSQDTVVTSENIGWTDWVNDHVNATMVKNTYPVGGGTIQTTLPLDPHLYTGYINRPIDIEVSGGPLSDTAVFGLAEAQYNFDSGATSFLYNHDFNDVTIPDGETWDLTGVEGATAGDTVELIFDNQGGATVEITNITYDGDIFNAVDTTTLTIAPYQRQTATLTVKSGVLANAEDTITVTHDSGGSVIPSPFTFTVKISPTVPEEWERPGKDFSSNQNPNGGNDVDVENVESVRNGGVGSLPPNLVVKRYYESGDAEGGVGYFDLQSLGLTDGQSYDFYLRYYVDAAGAAHWKFHDSIGMTGAAWSTFRSSGWTDLANDTATDFTDNPDSVVLTVDNSTAIPGTWEYRKITTLVWDETDDRYFWVGTKDVDSRDIWIDSLYIEETP